ncbi:MAG: GNAT family N-acetyltransferase [Candidatus Gottesmanbacteria bacterium]
MKPGAHITTFTDRKGRDVVVTSLQASDLPDLLRYANDLIDEDTFVLLSGKHLTHAHEEKYVRDAIKLIKKNKKIHLIARIDGVIASSFEVRILSLRKSHVGEIGISVAYAFRDSGIGRRCVEILISEAKKVGLKLLYLHVFENNPRAIHIYESVGFISCGVVPGMFLYKGEHVGETTMYLPL